MNLVRMMLAGSLMVSLCGGALVQKDLSFYDGDNVDISQNKTLDSKCVPPVLCPLPACDSSDFRFVLSGVWDDFDSGCGGEMFNLVSKGVLRKLKNPSAIDFSKPLIVSDTTLLSVVSPNTTANAPCTSWNISCPYFENPCPKRTWSLPPPTWYLAESREHDYYLFKFTSRKTVRVTDKPDREQVSISYILQTNGSLNFKGATVGVLNSATQSGRLRVATGPALTKRFGTPGADLRLDKIYDVRGRLIHAGTGAVKFTNRAPMVYIVKTQGLDCK